MKTEEFVQIIKTDKPETTQEEEVESAETNTIKEQKKQNLKAKEAEIYNQYVLKVSELEKAVKFTIELFERGAAENERYGKLVIEDYSMTMRVILSLYSTAGTMWGNIRAMSQRLEMRRKTNEAYLFAGIKNKYVNNGQKYTQKDIETETTIQNKDCQNDELKWEMLYARCTACKDVFGEQLRALAVMQQMRATELKNWGA